MAYRANPFLERVSERNTSDQEFARLFSPKIIERLPDDSFQGAIHIFRSPPGAGKTTLLRAFTPAVLRAFWNARRRVEMNESYQRLLARQVFEDGLGPQLLGVLLSCASGYADLPSGATQTTDSLFRALFDCRVVLRALRSLATLLSFETPDRLKTVRLEYCDTASELKAIPKMSCAWELAQWAENRERMVYAELDAIPGYRKPETLSHVRFEGVLWLQGVKFSAEGGPVAAKRLLMIDDLHKLRGPQRSLLLEELIELRPTIPIWLAERSSALGPNLISRGVRDGRDVREHALDDLWGGPGGQRYFLTFAQNVLDRRLEAQAEIPPGPFAPHLRGDVQLEEVRDAIERGFNDFRAYMARYSANMRYREWLTRAERDFADPSLESLKNLYATRILVTRDESKKQMALELAPLSAEELDDRDSSQVQSAAEIFMHEELNIPYYFGIERLCVMATGNVEELLSLAAALYEELKAKQILRKPELLLSAREQDQLVKEVAKRRRDFIPKGHREGTRAQRLLDSIGSYCRERTFLPNAPYAPGVTGVRLARDELARLGIDGAPPVAQLALLRRVLAECAAENLLVAHTSSASTSRDSGTIFYLNRTLCAHYGLPVQMGGWQDIAAQELFAWMEVGRHVARPRPLLVS